MFPRHLRSESGRSACTVPLYRAALAMATSNPSKDRNLLAVIGDEVCRHFRRLVLSRTSLYCRTQLQGFYLPGLAKLRRTRRISLSSSLVRNFLRKRPLGTDAFHRDGSPRYRGCIQRVHPEGGRRHPSHQPTRMLPVLSDGTQKASSIQIAERIRHTVDKYQQAFPALLEIPSKDHPYGTCLTQF